MYCKTSLAYRFLYFISFLLLLTFAGCAATKQPNLFDIHPKLLTIQYTPEEIRAVKQDFNANPVQYSQELGNLLLWQMHQKSPEFALEFAQTPELNDGINEKEARAMISIYKLIKDLDIPKDLFKKKAQYEDIDKIIMEWCDNSDKKTDWSGFFYQSPQGRVIDAKPINFEHGEDRIDYERLKKYGELKWESMSASEDRDSIIVTVKYPAGNKIFFDINGRMLSFTKQEMLRKDSLLFNEKNGLEGTLIIKNASDTTKLERELYALRAMVLAGENDYRFSAPLQALLWGYMDGKFNEGDNPFENYINLVEFVKPIWGDMKGKRWEDFDTVVERLNAPKLVDYYINKNIRYDRMVGPTNSPYIVFSGKSGDCDDLAGFGHRVLSNAGYKTFGRRAYNGPGDAHIGLGLKSEDGKYYLVVDFRGHMGNAMSGPYDSIIQIDRVLGYGTRYSGREHFIF